MPEYLKYTFNLSILIHLYQIIYNLPKLIYTHLYSIINHSLIHSSIYVNLINQSARLIFISIKISNI
jgi:hypothetical protein